MSGPILLASTNDTDLRFCKELALRTNLDLIVLRDVKEFKKNILTHPESFLFWDVDQKDFNEKGAPLSFPNFHPVIKKYFKPRQVFGMANRSLFDLSPVSQLTAVGHYLIRNYDAFALDWLAKVIRLTAFGVSYSLDHLSDDSAKVESITIKHTDEKLAAMTAVGDLLRKKFSERLCERILNNLDELILNALFDAPTDDDGKRYRMSTKRDESFALKSKERVTISLVFNEEEVIVCVTDQFASFSSEDAWKFLRQSYRNKRYTPDAGAQGAGLGLQEIAKSGVALMITIDKKRTHAMFAFPYFKRFKQSKHCFGCYSIGV